jgi:cysteine desulfurase
MDRIYFDYNATTPLAPEVIAAMRPYLEELHGNPSNTHWAGKRGRDAVDRARGQIARLLNCEPAEVLLTSGGTEANNSALAGLFFTHHGKTSPHFIVSTVEHPAISKTCDFLERMGAQMTRVPVDRFGQVDPEDIRRALRPNTALVSIMHANNEVGTIEPIAEIAAIARERGVLMHTDAAQTAGKLSVDVQKLSVDLLSVAGHKMYAPQGVGALFIRNGVRLEPLMHGAGHESGRRAGTENVLEIVGLGAAAELACARTDQSAIVRLRDHFWNRLREEFGNRVVLNGHPQQRLPNTLSISFVGQSGQAILSRISSLAASTGSACHAGSYDLSPVLVAMGLPEQVAIGTIRFSLGRNSTQHEVETVVAQLKKAINHD